MKSQTHQLVVWVKFLGKLTMTNSNTAILSMVLMLVVQAAYAEPVSISSGGHTKGASEMTTTYSGICKGDAYSIQFSRSDGKTIFKFHATPEKAIDLSDTQFGKTFKEEHLLGRFSLGCTPEGLNVSFVGYRVKNPAAATPVSYLAVLNKDGQFVADSGLRQETQEFIEHLSFAQ